MQAFENEPTPETTSPLEETTANLEFTCHQLPHLAGKSELSPNIKRIQDLIEGNGQGIIATNDGKAVLRAICSELGLLSDDMSNYFRAAEYYYEENFWDDYNNRTGLDLDALTNLEETGLYDKSEVFDDCDLLDTINALRRSVLHKEVVSDADRMARILLLHETGEIDLRPYMPPPKNSSENPVK